MTNVCSHCPEISIVIPARNEEKYLLITLPEILKQAVSLDKTFELIVVDNESSDKTVAVALSLGARVVSVSGTVGAVRCAGVNAAAGKKIVFIDADCLPSENWLFNGLEQLNESEESIVGCQTRRPDKSHWLVRCWALSHKEDDSPVSHLPGASLFFMKAIINVIGNFNPELSSSEDLDFTLRASNAGFRVYKAKSVIVSHLGWPDTISGFLRRQRWHASSYSYINRGARDPIFMASILFFLFHVLSLIMVLSEHYVFAIGCMFLSFGIALSHALRRIFYSIEPWHVSLLCGCFLVSYLYFAGRAIGIFEGWINRLNKKDQDKI